MVNPAETGKTNQADFDEAVFEVVSRYARTWWLLLEYDEDRLPFPAARHTASSRLQPDEARRAIAALKGVLLNRGEATGPFGQERGHGRAGILGAVGQSFGDQYLYLRIEEKAAHLLYFIINDHPFSDGNKLIGSFLFVLYLQQNGLRQESRFDNRALVALALFTAASDTAQKEVMIRLIINLIEVDIFA